MSTKQLKKYELPMETPVIATPFVLIFCALHKQCISQNLVNLTQPIVGWWIKRIVLQSYVGEEVSCLFGGSEGWCSYAFVLRCVFSVLACKSVVLKSWII